MNQQVDEYIIIRELGKGANGFVYLAKKIIDDGQHYAIKFQQTTDEKEIKLMDQCKGLSFKNVINTHKLFKFQQFLIQYDAIVMECCDQGDLYQYICKNRFTQNLNIERIKDFIFQIAYGIFELHSLEIIHRDIKPQNIMLSGGVNGQNFVLKICDFGLSKSFQQSAINTVQIGTPYYMAPELTNTVENQRNNYDKSIDIWAFGVVIYDFFDNQPLFQGFSLIDIFNKIQKGPRNEQILKINDMTLQEIIRGCLVVNGQNRLKIEEILIKLDKQRFQQLQPQLFQQNVQQQNNNQISNQEQQKNMPQNINFPNNNFQFNQNFPGAQNPTRFQSQVNQFPQQQNQQSQIFSSNNNQSQVFNKQMNNVNFDSQKFGQNFNNQQQSMQNQQQRCQTMLNQPSQFNPQMNNVNPQNQNFGQKTFNQVNFNTPNTLQQGNITSFQNNLQAENIQKITQDQQKQFQSNLNKQDSSSDVGQIVQVQVNNYNDNQQNQQIENTKSNQQNKNTEGNQLELEENSQNQEPETLILKQSIKNDEQQTFDQQKDQVQEKKSQIDQENNNDEFQQITQNVESQQITQIIEEKQPIRSELFLKNQVKLRAILKDQSLISQIGRDIEKGMKKEKILDLLNEQARGLLFPKNIY